MNGENIMPGEHILPNDAKISRDDFYVVNGRVVQAFMILQLEHGKMQEPKKFDIVMSMLVRTISRNNHAT